MRRPVAAAAVALACALGTSLPGGNARAQVIEVDRDQPVALVADRVEYDNVTGRVVAEGNVEVFYGERTLTAERIVYDANTGRISASGDIILRDPSGATVFADIADLDAELRDGLVEGARSVIGGDTTARLAALEARRFEDRYNALSKAVYSPCEVCEESPTPLWRIRARRVVHDEEERIIHYEGAWFDLFGVPVAYLPYFRHPDPTVERASGFLAPTFARSSNYGFGVRPRYYWAIDPSSDLTFQPLVTTGQGVIGDATYRRLFDTGGFFLRGTVTYADLDEGSAELQGHVDSEGLFDLDRLDDGAYWGWDVKVSSDDAYLRFFDISSEDRLTSEAFLRNYWSDGFYDLTGVYFQSLRDNEAAGDIPRVLPDFRARREFGEAMLGGEIGLFADSASLFRNEGTDVTRLSVGMDWERREVLPIGLSLRAFAELRGDLFLTFEDPGSGHDDTAGRLAPLAGVEARYPLIWELESGGAHVLEPIVQAIVAPYGGNGADFPNEDSLQTEFDETNLFSTNRFSGLDGFEEGPRLNLGLRYERISVGGLDLDATLGRVVRFADGDEFLPGTGLDETVSDWVGAWSASWEGIASVRQRVRLDDDFAVSRNEVSANVAYGPANAGVGYVFLEESPLAGTLAAAEREEVTAFAGLQVTPEWGMQGFLQRDLEAEEFVELGGQLTYANECCVVDLFLRKRFTESEGAPSSTSVGVEVELLTLGSTEERRGIFDNPSFSLPRLARTGVSGLDEPGRGE